MPHRVEVRYSNQPQTLLGWVDVSHHTVRLGQTLTFLVRPPKCDGFSIDEGRPLTLQIGALLGGGEPRLILKADGVGIESLRRIYEFTEAPDAAT